MQKYELTTDKKYGFMCVDPLPSQEELNQFYNTNYYDQGTYAVKYTPQEMIHKTIAGHEIEFISKLQTGRILDIGCGEGYVLEHFHQKKWHVVGLDFSHDGIKRHFPHLVEKVVKGDIYQSLEVMIKNKEKFDVIVCNNVLEHVRDPLKFLQDFKNLCHEKTIVRIQVPNDFSWLQKRMLAEGLVEQKYWVAPPAHLHYFNVDNLIRLLTDFGYKEVEVLGDFPIELFLLNNKSNYVKDRSVGPDAHKARVYFDVSLFEESLSRLVEFRKGCGRSGVCRNIIVYCQLK